MKRSAGIRIIKDYASMTDEMLARIDVIFRGRDNKLYQYNISTALKPTSFISVPKNVQGESSGIYLSNFIVSLEQLAKQLRKKSGYKYKRKSKKRAPYS